jgi:hypothetical protein
MEGERWKEAHRMVREEGNRQPRRARLTHADAVRTPSWVRRPWRVRL